MPSKPAEKIWQMQEDELAVWTLGADPDSLDGKAGFAAMRMRTSLNQMKSSKEVLEAIQTLNSKTELIAEYAKLLKNATLQNASEIASLADTGKRMMAQSEIASKYSENLALSTRNLVRATWGLVLITLVTQLPGLLQFIKNLVHR